MEDKTVKPPSRIWVCNGYFYNENEEKPDHSIEFVHTDLAQSLADALEEATNRLELFLSTFGDMGDQYATQADLNDWQAALANYRKGE